MLTILEDIAQEIHTQQSILNQNVIPTCYHKPNHHETYTCGIRQYPWHDSDGFVLEK